MLLARLHILEHHSGFLNLILTQDQRKMRIGLIGLFHLGFHAASGKIHIRRESFFPQLTEKLKGRCLGFSPQCDHKSIHTVTNHRQQLLLFKRQQDPFQANGKTYGRRSIATAFLNKAIVASTTSNSTLRTEWGILDFKSGLCIIIKSNPTAKDDYTK